LQPWRGDCLRRISAANEKIKDKMTLAKMLPFTNGPEEQRALTRALLG